jgi:biotin carboxyl carrier protein
MRRRAFALKLKADDKIKRVVICSGKVYYDLLAERDARASGRCLSAASGTVLPVPGAVAAHRTGPLQERRIVWCQEEPKNQGAWSFIEPELEWVLTKIGAKPRARAMRAAWPRPRPRRASPAATRPNRKPLSKERSGLVAVDEMLCPDKVTVEVPPRCPGRDRRPRRTTVAPNALLAQMQEKRPQEGMTDDVMVPALGESVTEATVSTWFKKVGDQVAQDEMLCELETDKVSVEVPAPVAGVLAEILAPKARRSTPRPAWRSSPKGAAAVPPGRSPRRPAAGSPGAAPAAVTGKDVEDAPSAKKAMAEAGLRAMQVRARAAMAA